MNFEESVTKLKTYLVNDNFNVLGYKYDEKQLQNLEPWFFMRNEKLGLPPECGEWLGMLRKKYPIAAQVRRRAMGVTTGPFYVFAIKADGLDLESAEQLRKDLEFDVNLRFETIYGDKKTNAYELSGDFVFPVYQLMYIWENEVSKDLFNKMRSLGTNKDDTVKVLLIDLFNHKSEKYKGIGRISGMPMPKNIRRILFGKK